MNVLRKMLKCLVLLFFSLPDSILVESAKICMLKHNPYPLQYWNDVAGAECYKFSNKRWFKNRTRLSVYRKAVEVGGTTYKIPIGVTPENKFFVYDYKQEADMEIVASSFISSVYFEKWRNCAVTGEICCDIYLNEENILPSKEYPCPANWDGWSCFPQAKYNTITRLPCPEYTRSSNDFPCILYSERECIPKGGWMYKTNYSTCATSPVYQKRHTFHVDILYVSIALSFPAVVIFTAYRNLRILRVNLHRNLLIACILRNIFTIMSKEIVILDALDDKSNKVMESNGVPCRVLAFLSSVAANAIYACMLMDGIHLHKLIVRIFSPDPHPWIFYSATLVLSFVPTITWSGLMAAYANEHCWMVDSSWYQWVTDGFRLAVLFINLILLIDIMRVLLLKLRKNVSAHHTKSTLKAMCFLIPLFGVPFILTANRNIVNHDSCKAGDIYYYVSYSLQALQGVMVAVVFCYWNKEVHNQISDSWRRAKIYYQNRFGITPKKKLSKERRDTAATYVHNNSVAPIITNGNLLALDNSTKVDDWLSSNVGKVQNVPDLVPFQEQNETCQASIGFERISRFIDDSAENLKD